MVDLQMVDSAPKGEQYLEDFGKRGVAAIRLWLYFIHCLISRFDYISSLANSTTLVALTS